MLHPLFPKFKSKVVLTKSNVQKSDKISKQNLSKKTESLSGALGHLGFRVRRRPIPRACGLPAARIQGAADSARWAVEGVSVKCEELSWRSRRHHGGVGRGLDQQTHGTPWAHPQ